METFGRMIVKIIDMKGKIVHREEMQEGKGLTQLNLNSSELSVGSYICRIIQGNKEKNIRFTKA